MIKRELLTTFYAEGEYNKITLDELMVYAHASDIEIVCIVKTPIYEFMISEDIIYNLNKLYKDMTFITTNVSTLTYSEIRRKFNDINVQVNFI